MNQTLTTLEPAPRKPGIWGLWQTIGFSIAILFVFFAVQGLVTVIFVAAKMVADPALTTSEIADMATNGLLLSIAIIASGIIGSLLILLFIKIKRGLSIAQYLGLRKISYRTVLVLLVIFAGFLILSTFLDQYLSQPGDAQFTAQTYKTSVWPALFWIGAVVFAPVFEESFFRGFLFVGIQRSNLGSMGAIIFTALFFAVLHSLQYSTYGVITILVLGIVFGIVRWKTNSLWSTILLHSLWNLAGMIGTAIYVHSGGA